MKLLWVLCGVAVLAVALYPTPATCGADDDTDLNAEEENSFKAPRGTDSKAAAREDKAITIDGMSVDEYQNLRGSAEKQGFQAEVSRMMKLIINSLYTNKEIFLRELISNASDALDKIRFLSLTDGAQLGSTPDLQIKIHVDRENGVLHITDTGIGMTKNELVRNLGTIAKSGTSEFLAAASGDASADHSNLIGQFGVGFYSAFLVADTVIVTSKHNDDKQWIWESDSETFSIMEDTRPEEQLQRGTRISLYLKEEASDYLEPANIRALIVKYSEFINFDIYLYTSKTVEEEEEVEVAEPAAETSEDGTVEDDATVAEDATKPTEKKMVERTVWDWEIINANKPIWNRNTKDVQDAEYIKFYHAFAKDTKDPVTYIHFTAEGEVAFRSILFVPGEAPANFYSDYGKKKTNLKMYVRRVFITDEFDDMLPKYLSFINGVVDSDDLPLNVSRESLQQHKLLKVIKKKLIRKALEMLKKMKPEAYKKFWTQFGTSIKLGIMEDYANRSRLSKLLRFYSSNSAEYTSLDDYVSRMKKGQENIFFCAGTDRSEAEKSPFVERLLKKGYEVLYTIEPVDEYCLQNLPEFDGKRFQNVAKEGLNLGDDSDTEKATMEEFTTSYKPLTDWMTENLKDQIDKAVVSNRLSDSPCALIAATHGWSGNMERIMKAQAYAKHDDSNNNYYATQKKTLEINPRHPLIKKLLSRIEADENTESTVELATVMIDAARICSGYSLGDNTLFARRIENLLRTSLGVAADETVDVESIEVAEEDTEEAKEDEAEAADEAEVHEEL